MLNKIEISLETAQAAIDCLCQKPLFDEEDEAATRAAIEELNEGIMKALSPRKDEEDEE